ncbi:hypothetical protein VNO77_19167 [Canavalia gladiata]|uniref:Uncharacterized protein n=1 Tax=Canavalia gladiata TaxID=3824 RepID=A0AAN9QPC9_CANGL
MQGRETHALHLLGINFRCPIIMHARFSIGNNNKDVELPSLHGDHGLNELNKPPIILPPRHPKGILDVTFKGFLYPGLSPHMGNPFLSTVGAESAHPQTFKSSHIGSPTSDGVYQSSGLVSIGLLIKNQLICVCTWFNRIQFGSDSRYPGLGFHSYFLSRLNTKQVKRSWTILIGAPRLSRSTDLGSFRLNVDDQQRRRGALRESQCWRGGVGSSQAIQHPSVPERKEEKEVTPQGLEDFFFLASESKERAFL